jgi:hypothetical protein
MQKNHSAFMVRQRSQGGSRFLHFRFPRIQDQGYSARSLQSSPCQLRQLNRKEGDSMRKLIVLSLITLDGVMQAPGGPGEDPTGGFKCGGWVFPYFDDFLGKVMVEQTSHPFDLLLGRKTYEIFAAHWPYVKSDEDPIASGINNAKKYVTSKTLTMLEWSNSELIKGISQRK